MESDQVTLHKRGTRLFFGSFFTFRAKFNGHLGAVNFDSFLLQVRFVVAWGFAVTVAYCVASHFAFSA